jgi:hypothetical protein
MRKLIGTVIFGMVAVYFLLQFFSTQLVSGMLESNLGVPVRVQRVHMRVAPVEFGVYGVKILSPQGFESKEMFSIPEVFVRVKLSSIFKGKIHITKLNFNLEHATVEKSKAGKISLKEFLDRAKKKDPGKPVPPAPQGPQKPQPPAKKKAPGVKLQVDEVLMNLGKVSYVEYNAAGERKAKDFQMNVKNLVLHDVTDLDSLSEQVVMTVLKKIGMLVMGMQFDKMVEDARTTLSNIFK